MFDETYQKNISALKDIDITLATQIIQASQAYSFELQEISEEHHLYNIVDTFSGETIYDNMVDELNRELKEINDINTHPFIYQYGISNAYTLATLLANSDHKRVVVIEPELELLFVALHLYDFSDALDLGRLKLIFQKNFTFEACVNLFKENNANYYARNFYLLQTAPYYTSHFQKDFEKAHEALIDALSFSISSSAKSFEECIAIFDEQKADYSQETLELLQTSSQKIIEVISSFETSVEEVKPLSTLVEELLAIRKMLDRDIGFRDYYHELFKPASILYMLELTESEVLIANSIAEEEHKLKLWIDTHLSWFKELKVALGELGF